MCSMTCSCVTHDLLLCEMTYLYVCTWGERELNVRRKRLTQREKATCIHMLFLRSYQRYTTAQNHSTDHLRLTLDKLTGWLATPNLRTPHTSRHPQPPNSVPRSPTSDPPNLALQSLPPKNAEIALLPNTCGVKSIYCVSQKQNRFNNKSQWYNISPTFIS